MKPEFNSMLVTLNKELRYIFDNDASFLDRFGKGDIMDLIQVCFTSHHVKIVYVLNSGQHVTDVVAMYDYLEWREEVEE